MILSSRRDLSPKAFPLIFFMVVICFVAILTISPAAAQRICTPCEHCDQDGDGLLRDSNRCLNKCIGFEFEDASADGPACSDESLPLVVELTAGGFDFSGMDPTADFTLNDRGNEARNGDLLVLVPVAVGEEPAAWDEVFAACPELFPQSSDYPSQLSISANDAIIQKSAGDIRIIFVAAGVSTGVGPDADITVQLIGQTDPILVLPQVPSSVLYTLDMFRIWGRTVRGAKGDRIRCASGELDLPDGITPTDMEVSATSP